MRQFISQGSTIEYLTLVPDDYHHDTNYPLLVWLHGFGADMHDLASLASEVHETGYIQVLPNAPHAGFAGPEGSVRAWFERGGKERPESVRRTVSALDGMLGELRTTYRLADRQALLIGFSQGGNLALRYGLPRSEVFAGLAALSCSLRNAEDIRETLPADKSWPIFLAHGVEDQTVPVDCTRRVARLLTDEGFRLTHREYHIGHEISLPLLGDLRTWILSTLPPRVAGTTG